MGEKTIKNQIVSANLTPSPVNVLPTKKSEVLNKTERQFLNDFYDRTLDASGRNTDGRLLSVQFPEGEIDSSQRPKSLAQNNDQSGFFGRTWNKAKSAAWKWVEWQDGKEATETLKKADAAYSEGHIIDGVKLGIEGNKQAAGHLIEAIEHAVGTAKDFVAGGEPVMTNTPSSTVPLKLRGTDKSPN